MGRIGARKLDRRQSPRKLTIEQVENRNLFSADLAEPLMMDNGATVVRANEPEFVQILDGQFGYYYENFDPNNEPTGAKIEILSPPENGSAKIEDGKLLYQPNFGFEGIDRLIISTESPFSSEWKSYYRVSVIVLGETWVATPDWATVTQGGSVQFDVLHNDYPNAHFAGVSGLELKLLSVESESGAEVSLASDNRSIIYQATSSYLGVDIVNYVAMDQQGYEVNGTAEVRVVPEGVPNRLWPEQIEQKRIELAMESNLEVLGVIHNFSNNFDQLVPSVWQNSAAMTGYRPISLVSTAGALSQVPGIGESDLVKTDGRYLYTIASKPSSVDKDFKLSIIDLKDSNKPVLVATIPFSGSSASLDLHDNQLTIFATIDAKTEVSVYDVSSPDEPSLQSSTIVNGLFESSRRVGEKLLVFTSDVLNPGLMTIAMHPDGTFRTAFGTELLAQLEDNYAHLDMAFHVHDAAGQLLYSGELTDFPQVLTLDREINVNNFENIYTFDTLSHEKPLLDWDIAKWGTFDQLLVTETSVYVANSLSKDGDVLIDKFGLCSDGLEYLATGHVDGDVAFLNFPLDEHDGKLRIVTQSDVDTKLFVLEQQENKLAIIGSLTGIGLNQNLTAIRFEEERVLLTTADRPTFSQFQSILDDPYYAIDLADPAHPTILGELHVPGYTTYLQHIDSNFVLSIGQSDIARPTDLAISIFDVRDSEHPLLVDRKIVENASDLGDYQTIRYIPETHTLSMSTRKNSQGWPIFGWGADEQSQNDWLIFRVDPSEKIELLNTIHFDAPLDRSLQVGQSLIGVANGQIKILPLLDLTSTPTEFSWSDVATITHRDLPLINVTPEPIEPEWMPTRVFSRTVAAGSSISITAKELGIPDNCTFVSVSGEHWKANPNSDSNTISFSPDRSLRGNSLIHYVVRDNSSLGLVEQQIAVTVEKWRWNNTENNLDCDGDGDVRPSDAIATINLLNERGPMAIETLDGLFADNTIEQFGYYDSNGDNIISAVDALLVINELNMLATERKNDVSGVVEGEEAHSSMLMHQPTLPSGNSQAAESVVVGPEKQFSGQPYYDLDQYKKRAN